MQMTFAECKILLELQFYMLSAFASGASGVFLFKHHKRIRVCFIRNAARASKNVCFVRGRPCRALLPYV